MNSHPPPKRITLVIHSLEGGGAERVCAMMANGWSAAGHHVCLITLEHAKRDVYPLDSRVHRMGLGLMGESGHLLAGFLNNRRRVKRLREAIRESKPDHVVSLVDTTNILTLLACRRLPVHVIVCEHTDPRHHSIGRAWSHLRRTTYPRCHALVVLTRDIADHCRSLVGDRPIYVVPNAVPETFERAFVPAKDEDVQSPTIVSAGRLTETKGYDRLIAAFARIGDPFADWHLKILGEGPQLEPLQSQAAELGLQHRVHLPGWVGDPHRHFQSARFYVCSSRYEGFPMVLLEAMACGLPVVSFDCQSGPAEIVRDGIDGLLVPPNDVDALANAMQQLMADNDLRERLASRAPDVCKRFSLELFFRRWDAILANLPVADFDRDFSQ